MNRTDPDANHLASNGPESARTPAEAHGFECPRDGAYAYGAYFK